MTIHVHACSYIYSIENTGPITVVTSDVPPLECVEVTHTHTYMYVHVPITLPESGEVLISCIDTYVTIGYACTCVHVQDCGSCSSGQGVAGSCSSGQGVAGTCSSGQGVASFPVPLLVQCIPSLSSLIYNERL